MTIPEYNNEFERQLKLRNMAGSTIGTYTSILKVFLVKIYKDPRAITVRMVEDYLLTIKSTRYKIKTIYCLQNFYKCVMGMPGHLDTIPIPKKEKYVPNTLNAQEVYRLINSIDNLKQRACIQLIYACGLRLGEVVNIKIADIDGVRLQLHVRQAKGAKDRVVPIPEETIIMLRQYYQKYKPEVFLFGGQTGGKYDERSVQQVFHRAKEKAGIKKYVTVHTLRHSRATHLVDNGVDMSLIQKFLGHSNIKTTVDFYLHTSIQTMQNIFSMADKNIQANVNIGNSHSLRLSN